MKSRLFQKMVMAVMITAALTCINVIPAAATELPESVPSLLGPGYDSTQLAQLARVYFETHFGYMPEYADCQQVGENEFRIQLYDIVMDEEAGHTTTSAWYTVNKYGEGENDLLQEPVRLDCPFYGITERCREAEKFLYEEQFYACADYYTSDPELIDEILAAMEEVKFGLPTDISVTDSDIVLVFYLPEEETVSFRLEAGCLVCGKSKYTLENGEALGEALCKVKGVDPDFSIT